MLTMILVQRDFILCILFILLLDWNKNGRKLVFGMDSCLHCQNICRLTSVETVNGSLGDLYFCTSPAKSCIYQGIGDQDVEECTDCLNFGYWIPESKMCK